MSLRGHIIASAVVSCAFGLYSYSWPATAACFLAGIVVDFDHLFDYWIREKRMCWDVTELEEYCLVERKGKMYLIFHSFELLMLLWVLAYYFHLGYIWIGILTGWSTHLIIDQIANDCYPLAYFWVYRAKYNFPKIIYHDQDFRREYKKTNHDKK